MVQPALLKSLQQQIRAPLTLTPFQGQMNSAAVVTHLAQILEAGQLQNNHTSNAFTSNTSTLSKALGTQPILFTPGLQMAAAQPINTSVTSSTSTSTSTVTLATTTPTFVTLETLRAAQAVQALGQVGQGQALGHVGQGQALGQVGQGQANNRTTGVTATTTAQPTIMTAAALQGLRPGIIGTAGGAQFMTGLSPALLTQAIPRANVPGGITSQQQQVLGSVGTQGSSVQQLMAFANMAPGTQLVSPMLMSPGVHLAGPGWTQAQLNSVLAQPLLKQYPFFQPGLQVVKPLLVVSVPSVVTTTAAATASSTQVAVTTKSK